MMTLRVTSAGGICLLLLLMTGCFGGGNGEKPWDTTDGRKALAKEAGEAAAFAYLAAVNPTPEEAAAVKSIVDKVAASLTEYKDGGFITALPELEKVIEDELPGDDKKALRMICRKAARVLLEELDRIFERHPDWKTLSEEIAGITSAFFEGASIGLTGWRQRKIE